MNTRRIAKTGKCPYCKGRMEIGDETPEERCCDACAALPKAELRAQNPEWYDKTHKTASKKVSMNKNLKIAAELLKVAKSLLGGGVARKTAAALPPTSSGLPKLLQKMLGDVYMELLTNYSRKAVGNDEDRFYLRLTSIGPSAKHNENNDSIIPPKGDITNEGQLMTYLAKSLTGDFWIEALQNDDYSTKDVVSILKARNDKGDAQDLASVLQGVRNFGKTAQDKKQIKRILEVAKSMGYKVS